MKYFCQTHKRAHNSFGHSHVLSITPFSLGILKGWSPHTETHTLQGHVLSLPGIFPPGWTSYRPITSCRASGIPVGSSPQSCMWPCVRQQHPPVKPPQSPRCATGAALARHSAASRRFDHMFLPSASPIFWAMLSVPLRAGFRVIVTLVLVSIYGTRGFSGTLSTWLKKLSVQSPNHFSGMVVTLLIHCCMCELTQYHRTPGTHLGCAAAMFLRWEAAERAGQAGSHHYRVFLTVRSGQRIQGEVSSNALVCMYKSQKAEYVTTLFLNDLPSV